MDKTWFDFYKRKLKRRFVELKHTDSPEKEMFRAQRSLNKVMVTVFWDI